MGISVEEAAWRIRQTVDQVIADGLTSYGEARNISADVLFAYGGGGPTHVATVADLINISTAYCFPMSPVFSAYGSSRMDISHLYETSVIENSSNASVDEMVDAMKEEAQRDMLGEGFDASSVSYEIQAGFTLEADPQTKAHVALESEVTDAVIAEAKSILSSGGSAEGSSVVWDSVRVKATAPSPHPELANPDFSGDYQPKDAGSSRSVWTGDTFEDVPVHEVIALSAGDLVEGPAIIESDFTTIFVTQNRNACIDGAKNIVLRSKDS